MATCPWHVAALLGSAWLLRGAAAFDLQFFGGGASSWIAPSRLLPAPAKRKHAADELDEGQLKGYLKEHSVAFILFYAPWCFYSQQVMPAWDVAMQKLKLHHPPVHLARIDASREESVAAEYGITSFPTMKLFVDDAVYEYESEDRAWQQIVTWVNGHLDRDHLLQGSGDLDAYLNGNDLHVVGLLPGAGNASAAFARVARSFEDVVFAEARSEDVAKEVAARLARHAALECKTINVGTSEGDFKEVPLPRAGMQCGSRPSNPQRFSWGDQFSATVVGNRLNVTRVDEPEGWDQLLQLECCSEEDSSRPPTVHIPVPSVAMFFPHDERFALYDGDLEDWHNLHKWIAARRMPLVMHFDEEVAERILASNPENWPTIFLIRRGNAEALEHELGQAAVALRGRAFVVLSGIESPVERRLVDLAGADEDSLPIVTLVEAVKGGRPGVSMRRFRLPVQGLTSQSVVDWVSELEQGRLKPWLRSEPEPPAEDALAWGSVVQLVGTTFPSLVYDATKDVLVDFYAPWCGHCRKFEPSYKALARKLRHVRSLRVARLDGTRNEVEGMMVDSFPMVILFPAGGPPKQQVVYMGSRETDDIIGWLHEHCSIKFEDQPPPEEAARQAAAEGGGLLDPSEDDL